MFSFSTETSSARVKMKAKDVGGLLSERIAFWAGKFISQ